VHGENTVLQAYSVTDTVYITTTEVATFMCDILLQSYHRCPVQEVAFLNVEGIFS